MPQSSLSVLAFAVYMGGFSFALLFFPDPVLNIFGIRVVQPWVGFVAYFLAVLSFYYILAVRQQMVEFYKWTVYGRLPLVLIWTTFAVLKFVPPIVCLIGIFETGCAIWTAVALKQEQRW